VAWFRTWCGLGAGSNAARRDAGHTTKWTPCSISGSLSWSTELISCGRIEEAIYAVDHHPPRKPILANRSSVHADILGGGFAPSRQTRLREANASGVNRAIATPQPSLVARRASERRSARRAPPRSFGQQTGQRSGPGPAGGCWATITAPPAATQRRHWRPGCRSPAWGKPVAGRDGVCALSIGQLTEGCRTLGKRV